MRTAFVFTVSFVTFVGIIISILNLIPVPEYRVYDCSVAEFHPDYPQDVREECRKIRRTGKIIST